MDNHENMSDGKTSFLIGVVVFALIAIAVIIYVAADIVSDALERPRSNQDIVETTKRIEPVGKVNLASNPNPDLCLLYTSPSPRDGATSRMPSSA